MSTQVIYTGNPLTNVVDYYVLSIIPGHQNLTNTHNLNLPIDCVVAGNQPDEKNKYRYITDFRGILKNIFRE